MNQVMRRNPSASHCVANPLRVAYRPSRRLFFCGRMRLTVSSVKRSGTSAMASCSALTAYWFARSIAPSSEAETNSTSSPCSSSGASACEPAGLRRTESVARTIVSSARMSTSSVTRSIRYAGGW
jgi:hypothetical protein